MQYGMSTFLSALSVHAVVPLFVPDSQIGVVFIET